MARTVYRPDASQKIFDITNDFSGGMNSVDADSTMPNNQLRLIENMELTTKGALVKREGFSRHFTLPLAKSEDGIGLQCAMTYFDKNMTKSCFYMFDGSIYNSDGVLQKYKNLDGGFVDATGFQKIKVVDYVVYQDIMILLTGNFFLEYGEFPDDEENTTQSYYFRQMKPYKPTALEYSKLGGNMLSDDPENFISDGTASILVNEGIVAKHRTATANVDEEFTTYLSRPTGAEVSIKWEIQDSNAEDNTVWEDINKKWQPINFETLENKKITHTFLKEGKYNIKSSITLTSNVSGETVTDETKVYSYIISDFIVTAIEDIEQKDKTKPQTCTRALLYYDQLITWGDDNVDNAIYISDVFRPSYFPQDFVLLIETTQEDRVVSLNFFFETLVIFTENTIWDLQGRNPSEFNLVAINRTLGCVAERSVVPVGTGLLFLSREGIYKLKTLSTITLDRFNVERIDLNIYKSIPKPYDETSNAVLNGLSYVITMPKYKLRFKYYYEQKVWAMDRGDIFDFNFTNMIAGEYFGYRPNGTIVKQDPNKFNDDGLPIKCVIETKAHDLGLPFHTKKFKNVKLAFLNDSTYPTNLFMTIKVDDAIILNPEKYTVYEQDDQILFDRDKATNITLLSGAKYGSWIMSQSRLGTVPVTINKYRLVGKGYNIKLILEHEEDKDFGLLGYSYIFKVKKP